MTNVDWQKFFQNHQFLKSLTDHEIGELLLPDVSREESYDGERVIVAEGQQGNELYFVGRGSVSISMRDPEGREIPLGSVDEGDFFGELTLLGERPRSATVRAKGPCVLLNIDAAHFLKVLHKRQDIISAMLLVLVERLRLRAEMIIDVAYEEINHKVDHKLELFSTKLDAELKAVNTSLAASQTVFEQTNTRAHEAIASTERSWSNIVRFGSAVGVVLSVLGGMIAWLGFQRFSDLESSAQEKVTEIEKQIETVNQLFKKTDESAKQAQENAEIIEAARAGFVNGAILTMTPYLLEQLRTSVQFEIHADIARNLLQSSIASGNPDIMTQVFRDILQQILLITPQKPIVIDKTQTTWDEIDYETKRFEAIRIFLHTAIENRYNPSIHPRDVAIAYYFTLVCLAIEQSASEYKKNYDDLQYYLQNLKPPYILGTDRDDFEPSSFDVLVDSFQKKELLKGSVGEEIKKNIYLAWSEISK